MDIFVILLLALDLRVLAFNYTTFAEDNSNHVKAVVYSVVDPDKCPKVKQPLCGTNGKEYLYFENKCHFETKNYEELAQGSIEYHECPLSLCAASNCATCDSASKPVCAVEELSGAKKTFSNACELKQEMCKTKREWRIVNLNECNPIYTNEILNQSNTLWYNSDCPEFCTSEYEPICASFMNTEKEFLNECYLQNTMCQTKKKWEITRRGSCQAFNDSTVTGLYSIGKDCARACPTEYNPICAKLYNKMQVFNSKCELEKVKCEGHDWQIVKQGSCPKSQYNLARNECPKLCTNEYRPVCAGYKGKEKEFENSCKLLKAVCEGEISWKLLKTGHCSAGSESESSCPSFCPSEFIPVCGSFNGELRDFFNSCELRKTSCETDIPWQTVKGGTCFTNSLDSLSDSESCPQFCSNEYQPICAEFETELIQFPNKCEMQKAICETNTNWQLFRKGPCNRTNDSMNSCPKVCSKVFSPICVRFNGELRSFDNTCELRRSSCEADAEWELINKGPCGVSKPDELRQKPCDNEALEPICAIYDHKSKTFNNICHLAEEIKRTKNFWSIVYKGICNNPVAGRNMHESGHNKNTSMELKTAKIYFGSISSRRPYASAARKPALSTSGKSTRNTLKKAALPCVSTRSNSTSVTLEAATIPTTSAAQTAQMRPVCSSTKPSSITSEASTTPHVSNSRTSTSTTLKASTLPVPGFTSKRSTIKKKTTTKDSLLHPEQTYRISDPKVTTRQYYAPFEKMIFKIATNLENSGESEEMFDHSKEYSEEYVIDSGSDSDSISFPSFGSNDETYRRWTGNQINNECSFGRKAYENKNILRENQTLFKEQRPKEPQNSMESYELYFEKSNEKISKEYESEEYKSSSEEELYLKKRGNNYIPKEDTYTSNEKTKRENQITLMNPELFNTINAQEELGDKRKNSLVREKSQEFERSNNENRTEASNKYPNMLEFEELPDSDKNNLTKWLKKQIQIILEKAINHKRSEESFSDEKIREHLSAYSVERKRKATEEINDYERYDQPSAADHQLFPSETGLNSTESTATESIENIEKQKSVINIENEQFKDNKACTKLNENLNQLSNLDNRTKVTSHPTEEGPKYFKETEANNSTDNAEGNIKLYEALGTKSDNKYNLSNEHVKSIENETNIHDAAKDEIGQKQYYAKYNSSKAEKSEIYNGIVYKAPVHDAPTYNFIYTAPFNIQGVDSNNINNSLANHPFHLFHYLNSLPSGSRAYLLPPPIASNIGNNMTASNQSRNSYNNQVELPTYPFKLLHHGDFVEPNVTANLNVAFQSLPHSHNHFDPRISKLPNFENEDTQNTQSVPVTYKSSEATTPSFLSKPTSDVRVLPSLPSQASMLNLSTSAVPVSLHSGHFPQISFNSTLSL